MRIRRVGGWTANPFRGVRLPLMSPHQLLRRAHTPTSDVTDSDNVVCAELSAVYLRALLGAWSSPPAFGPQPVSWQTLGSQFQWTAPKGLRARSRRAGVATQHAVHLMTQKAAHRVKSMCREMCRRRWCWYPGQLLHNQWAAAWKVDTRNDLTASARSWVYQQVQSVATQINQHSRSNARPAHLFQHCPPSTPTAFPHAGWVVLVP